MDPDSFRFLQPWTDLLPRRGGAVVAVVGSGGCTTLLLRVIDELLAHEPRPRVLVTQTTPHPVPLQHLACFIEFDIARLPTPDRWEHGRLVWVAGAAHDSTSDRRAGLAAADCDALIRALAPDVVLVQAHASCGTPLRCDAIAPVWPPRTHLALVVAPLAAVGRLWNPRSVAGVTAQTEPSGEPRRVRSEDVLDQVRGLVAQIPDGARPLPFLTGFGSFRDLDGMFAIVQALWDPPRLPVVCLAELLGDERRDAADRAALGVEEATLLGDERVYAVYPALMDGDEDV